MTNTVSNLALALALPVAEVLPALLGLELKGLVRSVGGRYERRLQRGARP